MTSKRNAARPRVSKPLTFGKPRWREAREIPRNFKLDVTGRNIRALEHLPSSSTARSRQQPSKCDSANARMQIRYRQNAKRSTSSPPTYLVRAHREHHSAAQAVKIQRARAVNADPAGWDRLQPPSNKVSLQGFWPGLHSVRTCPRSTACCFHTRLGWHTQHKHMYGACSGPPVAVASLLAFWCPQST